MSEVDYGLAPCSIATWFPSFADIHPGDRVLMTGEVGPMATEAVSALLADRDRRVIFYSSHESLLRDVTLAEQLSATGRQVFAQTREGALLGLDKVAFKRHLDVLDLPTPRWGVTVPSGPTRPRLLKERCGTQSRGLTWYQGDGAPFASSSLYWEDFVDGTEYSVLVYVDERGRSVFPVIWKGSVAGDLTPPWKRLRMCPPPPGHAADASRLIGIAQRFLDSVAVRGFVEFEFIVAHNGEVSLLEINPRVCGTMRIAAMAAGIRLFSLPVSDQAPPPALVATAAAAEVPYEGPPWASPDGRIFATSRLTFAAPTMAELPDFMATTTISREWAVELRAACGS